MDFNKIDGKPGLYLVCFAVLSLMIFCANFYFYSFLVRIIHWLGDGFSFYLYSFPIYFISSIVVLSVSYVVFSRTLWGASRLSLGIVARYLVAYSVFVVLIFILTRYPVSMASGFLTQSLEGYTEELSVSRTRFVHFVTGVVLLIFGCLFAPFFFRISFIFPSAIVHRSVNILSAFSRSRGMGRSMALAIGAYAVPYWLIFKLLPAVSGSLADLLTIDAFDWAFGVAEATFAAALILYSLRVIAQAFNSTTIGVLDETWD
ncbi:hypothetical protein [uncultured Roseibium sp.]|uniref:hypothetical protein n=1 Tax=uncultured Roseibium sp. TaxID=1936171 RepID=UPI002605F7E6|nr:hypothetical protein [uncultured Roseibium sp.]